MRILTRRRSGRRSAGTSGHLSFGLTLDNTGVLSGSCGDAVSYEIVRTAAEAFSPPAGQLDTRTAAQRRMDGLVAACKAALDGVGAPERHGSAPHITVLVKDETLAQAAATEAAAQGAGMAPGYAAAGRGARRTRLPGGRRPGRWRGRGRGAGPGRGTRRRSVPPGRWTAPEGVGDRVRHPRPVRPAARRRPARLAGAPPGQTGHGTLLTARQVLPCAAAPRSARSAGEAACR